MKALSEKQARQCEEACTPRCRCRCKGALHGIGRGGSNAPRSFYEQLPEADPHKVNAKQENVPQEAKS